MKKRIVGILLAAGNSRRMGMPKLSMPLGKATIGSFVLKQAVLSQLDHIFVVVQKSDPAHWIQMPAPIQKKWSVLECEDAFRGQSFSLKAGVEAAQHVQAKAAVVLLGDQPFIEADMINELVGRYQSSQAFFIASRFEKILRPPVLFSAEVFPVLFSLSGDQGAGSLFKEKAFLKKGAVVDFKLAKPFFDIDTKEDYEQAVRSERDEYANASANSSLAASQLTGSMHIKKEI